MSRYNYRDIEETPIDELFEEYLDADSPFVFPLVYTTSDGLKVMRDCHQLASAVSSQLFAFLPDFCAENADEEGNCDVLPYLARISDDIQEKVLDVPSSTIAPEIWDEAAQEIMMENLTGSLPYALFDEDGTAWQVNTHEALFDLFSCYTAKTFGEGMNPHTCWIVFAEDSGLDEASSFIEKNMMALVWGTLEKGEALHNPSDVYIADDEPFIVRCQGSDTMIDGADDFAAYISFAAESDDDAVELASFIARHEVFLRPIYADLARALESCPAFVEGGWGDFPYIAEKIDDPAVQSRIRSMNDFLDFMSDMPIQDWIDECFREFPDVADLAAHFMEGTGIYHRY